MRLPALALAQRALLLDARGHSSYVLRGLLVALMLLALWIAHEWSRWVGAAGLHLFGWVIRTDFVFIAGFGVSTFSAVIAEEKENMTLGLLQMAGFGANSILVGKSVGQLLTMVLLVLVQLPFILLAVTLGGVSQHQILAAYVILFAHLLFVYGLALLCSVLASHPGSAARLTGMLLLAYYLLPRVGAWLLGQPGLGSDPLADACRWLAANSAWDALGATAANGYAAPLLDTPVLVTLAMAAALFAAGGLAFRLCSREETATAPRRGFFEDFLHRGRNRAVTRPVGHPLFWKDFHFLSGGVTGLVLRFAAYGLLLWAARAFVSGSSDLELGSVSLNLLLLATVIDLGLQAARVFREEIHWHTLPALMLLPVPMRNWAYAKVAGCAISAAIPLCYCGVLIWLTPSAFAEAMNRLLSRNVGWYLLGLVMAVLHLTVLLSLHLRRGALPLAVLLVFLFTGVIQMLNSAAISLILAVILGAGSLGLHPAIGRQVRARAAE